MAEDEWQLEGELRPPPDVTREQFLAWRDARRGGANPELMTNPVWAWLARQPDVTAYQANRHFIGSREAAPPGWTNHRFGQSTTELPDGRTVAIAGEHEDYYDPDFFIYNDVLVTAPGGDLAIYGYPPDVFPPTDFHSATLVGDHIYIVGNLGYRDARRRHTPVVRLDLRTWAIEQIETTGESPGWISRHTAVLDGRALIVGDGRCEVERDGRRFLRDSVDDHVLELDTLVWRRLTDRRWSQYTIERAGGYGKLWDIHQLADALDRQRDGGDPWWGEQAAKYRARIDHEPDLDAWRTRFRPPLAHTPRPRDPDDWRVHRITVEGVTVRYVDESRGVHLIVEGPLPAATVATLVEDVRVKLARADAGAYEARCLDDAR